MKETEDQLSQLCHIKLFVYEVDALKLRFIDNDIY